MKKFKEKLEAVLANTKDIDWLIVHQISETYSPLKKDGIKFSFVDKENNDDEPFGKRQGYICLDTKGAIENFKVIIDELAFKYKSNKLLLANLYILIIQVSCMGKDKEILLDSYKRMILLKQRKEILFLLIDSLNEKYFSHKTHFATNAKSINEWLNLFSSAQYLHAITDPVWNSLRIIGNKLDKAIDFIFIEKMNPLVRSILIGWWGIEFSISKERIKTLLLNENELIFLSAILIDSKNPNTKVPNWLNKEFMSVLLEKHWIKIGKTLFNSIWGLNYRYKNKNKVYSKMQNLFHEIFRNKISIDNEEIKEWINKLVFSEDFISLFNWVHYKKDNFKNISQVNKELILKHFLNELDRIANELPQLLAEDKYNTPFNSYQLSEPKLKITLAYLLLLFLSANKIDFIKFKSVCFKFKVLFFGGSKANYLGKQFAELVLLIGLSSDCITNMEANEFALLKRYLQVISDTILIPYIHVAERDDEIWNDEKFESKIYLDKGHLLVNDKMLIISKSELLVHYEYFFKTFKDVKVATWPFERDLASASKLIVKEGK